MLDNNEGNNAVNIDGLLSAAALIVSSSQPIIIIVRFVPVKGVNVQSN